MPPPDMLPTDLPPPRIFLPPARYTRPRRHRARAVIMVALVALAVLAAPSTFGGNGSTGVAAAAGFNKNLLISDAMFDATGTMTTAQIQAFLNRYPNSCLRNHRAPKPLDYSRYGADTSAAEIIRTSALMYGVNPQVLLVTLEKEQTLVSGTAGCAPWRYWSAMGYACPDGGSRYDYPSLGITGTCVSAERHAGFSAQVNHGAWQLQFNRQRAVGNLDWRGNQNVANYGFYTKGYRQQYAGAPRIYYDGTATISGQLVTMTNGPTATLYTYTPHLSANQVFVTLFTNWFGSPTGTPSAPPTTTPPTTTAPPPGPHSRAEYGRFADRSSRILLGRPTTPAEQEAWANYLKAGGPMVNMVRIMTAVPEHDQHVVASDYLRMLGRPPDAAGAVTWVRMLQKTGRNDAVLSGLAGSGEYYRRCSSDDAMFVKCLYLDLLGRPVDPSGFATWTHQLSTGRMTRRTVADRILASAEYTRHFVDQSYRQILGRSADSSGLATWGRIYDRAGSEDAVRGGLIRSGEGFRRLSAP